MNGARGRFALTLVEAIVTLLVAIAILGAVLAFFYNSQVWSRRSTAQAQSLAEIRVALARITRELREGKQIDYPAVGRRSQPGLGFVNARGETIFFHLVPSTDAPAVAPYDLVRERAGATRELVLRHVTRLLVTTADPGQGRDPVLVRLVLTRMLGETMVQGDAGVSLVTSVAVRGVRPRCLALR